MAKKKAPKKNTSTVLPFEEYDQAIVSFSGGKDSLACVLHLLEIGFPADRIELWHQAVDGRPGVAERFFDWPVTEAYCNATAKVLGIPIRYQWREHGFLGEMLKGEFEDEGPYALHSSVITAYFRIDEDGRHWTTRNYYNATLYTSADEATRAPLPAPGSPVEQFFTQAEMDKIDEEFQKRKDEIAGDKELTRKERAKKREKAEEWYARKIGPLEMPPIDLVQVTSPRPTAKIGFELYPGGLDDGAVGSASGGGDPGVRLQFPNPSADLRSRWCSSNLKIDVAKIAITNDRTYDEGNFLFITGERRQESENRAHYAEIERHKATKKTGIRRVDHWRPVLDWDEQEVWDIIARARIRPHPGYYLGWGRLSCLSCIFGNPNQWASVKQIAPDLFERILQYEHRFGKTVQAGGDVEYLASEGSSHVSDDPGMMQLAMGEALGTEYVRLAEGEEWEMPSGAFKRTGGPL
jgi:3'-phosphoadenosine 5'-phosphosulfate sulfotransferase (PAPS reductase)/FAD synthetase